MLPSLSLDQLDDFVKAGVAQTTPAPPPPVQHAAPAQAAPPMPPIDAPFETQFPELRVVDGVAHVSELSLIIARSCKRYGGGMRQDGDKFILRCYDCEFVVTETQAFRDGRKVWYVGVLQDAVRLLSGKRLSIGRVSVINFAYAYHSKTAGYFAPGDTPAAPPPMSDD